MENVNNTFADKIKAIRNDSGYNNKEVAKFLEVSVGTLSNYENGKKEPSLSFLVRFCNAFNVDMNELLSIKKIQNNELKITNIEATKALHACKNEVVRLEGLLAEKEELIKELRARITDKEKMVSMLEKQLKVHESTQNKTSI